jgi:hypothetical protein
MESESQSFGSPSWAVIELFWPVKGVMLIGCWAKFSVSHRLAELPSGRFASYASKLNPCHRKLIRRLVGIPRADFSVLIALRPQPDKP